jgi:hypothetical protein
MNNTPIQAVASEMNLVFKTEDHAGMIRELASKVNSLLTTDFEKLIFILYRMDVSEIKLKQLLKDHPDEDAGNLIAELMIKNGELKTDDRITKSESKGK